MCPAAFATSLIVRLSGVSTICLSEWPSIVRLLISGSVGISDWPRSGRGDYPLQTASRLFVSVMMSSLSTKDFGWATLYFVRALKMTDTRSGRLRDFGAIGLIVCVCLAGYFRQRPALPQSKEYILIVDGYYEPAAMIDASFSAAASSATFALACKDRNSIHSTSHLPWEQVATLLFK
jgi:hypothetical protein